MGGRHNAPLLKTVSQIFYLQIMADGHLFVSYLERYIQLSEVNNLCRCSVRQWWKELSSIYKDKAGQPMPTEALQIVREVCTGGVSRFLPLLILSSPFGPLACL